MAARLTPEPTVLGALYVIERRVAQVDGDAGPAWRAPAAVCPDGTTLAQARAEARRLDRYADAGTTHHVHRVPVRVPRA